MGVVGSAAGPVPYGIPDLWCEGVVDDLSDKNPTNARTVNPTFPPCELTEQQYLQPDHPGAEQYTGHQEAGQSDPTQRLIENCDYAGEG